MKLYSKSRDESANLPLSRQIRSCVEEVDAYSDKLIHSTQRDSEDEEEHP